MRLLTLGLGQAIVEWQAKGFGDHFSSGAGFNQSRVDCQRGGRHRRFALRKLSADLTEQVERAKFAKLAPIGIPDPSLLFLAWYGQANEQQFAAGTFNSHPYPVGQTGRDRGLGAKREDDRLPRFTGFAKHRQPKRFAKSNKATARKRENGCHSINDQVIVEEPIAGQRCQLSCYGELSGRGRTVDKDKFHREAATAECRRTTNRAKSRPRSRISRAKLSCRTIMLAPSA